METPGMTSIERSLRDLNILIPPYGGSVKMNGLGCAGLWRGYDRGGATLVFGRRFVPITTYGIGDLDYMYSNTPGTKWSVLTIVVTREFMRDDTRNGWGALR